MMFRGFVLLQFCLLPVAVLSMGSGCAVDTAGKSVCPEYGGDSSALLQSKLTIHAPMDEPDDDQKQQAPLMVQIGTGPPAVIDVDVMVADLKTRAAEDVAALRLNISNLQPELDASKAKFKSDRKAMRVNYKACRKKITWNKKKWKDTSQCRPFKAHLSGSGLKSKCAKKPRCVLKQARKQAKRAAKDEYKMTRMKVRDYKKQLRKATFEKNILPKIIMLLKPALLKALKAVDMTQGGAQGGALKACTSASDADCIPLALLGSATEAVALLRHYMTTSLNSVLNPTLTVLIDKYVNANLWKLVGSVVASLKASIQVSVGSIPFVGGALAVAVGLLIETIYDYVRWGVETAFDGVRAKLQEALVTSIVTNVFATGQFTDEALKDPSQMQTLASGMATAADATQSEVVLQAQSSIADAATGAEAQAEQDAAGAEASIETDGQTVKEGEESDEREDADAEEEEDGLDIDDEDND